MNGRRLFRAAVLLLPAAVAACTIFPEWERKTQTIFLLSGNLPGAERSGEPSPGRSAAPVTVLVNRPRARPGFDTPRMAYLPHPGEVRYFAFHEWADTPGRMLAPMAVNALEGGGCCRTIVQVPAPVEGDLRLDIEDLALGQEFFGSPSVVRLSFRALLVDLRNRDVVSAKRFEAAVPARGDDPRSGADAAGRAAEKVLGELSKWVEESVAAREDRGGSGKASPTVNPPPDTVIR